MNVNKIKRHSIQRVSENEELGSWGKDDKGEDGKGFPVNTGLKGNVRYTICNEGEKAVRKTDTMQSRHQSPEECLRARRNMIAIGNSIIRKIDYTLHILEQGQKSVLPTCCQGNGFLKVAGEEKADQLT